MTEPADPKHSFNDRALPVVESLRLRSDDEGVDANDDNHPEFYLTAAIGIVRAMESSLAEFDARQRVALETVRDLVCDARRSIRADRGFSGERSLDAV
ncbi:MAG TPA: hypothetical protein VGO76_08785 [Luteibacter sp.]|jgi:hypothetical protein|nr:hypothetical protein [Luteibacter sp.]